MNAQRATDGVSKLSLLQLVVLRKDLDSLREQCGGALLVCVRLIGPAPVAVTPAEGRLSARS